MKIKNPKLTITTDVVLEGVPKLINGNIVQADATGTVEAIVIYDADYDVFYFEIDTQADFAVTDTVNCSFDSPLMIIITDPTKDASCTIEESVG